MPERPGVQRAAGEPLSGVMARWSCVLEEGRGCSPLFLRNLERILLFHEQSPAFLEVLFHKSKSSLLKIVLCYRFSIEPIIAGVVAIWK